MAELNEVVTYRVRDLEVDVEMEWGEAQAIAKLIKTVDESEATTIFDVMTRVLKKSVTGIRGLTRKGKPVEWNADMLPKMGTGLVGEIFRALMNPTEATQVGDPLAPTDAVAGT